MAMNKRVECQGPDRGFEIVSRPIPEPPADGLIVKCLYSGICHTDVHLWRNELKIDERTVSTYTNAIKGFAYPAVFGHEISGEVYTLGSNYKGDLKVGDRVAAHPWFGCDKPECGECSANEPVMCPLFLESNLGIGQPGGFQQYMSVANARYAVKVDKAIDMPVASIMTCSGITAYKAVSKLLPSVERAVKMRGKAHVLIIGAGGVGLWGIQWAKSILPAGTRVYIADITEEKIKGGVAHGADEGILWDRAASFDDLIQLTKDRTEGGIDGSVDFVGLPITTGKAVRCARKGATNILVGLAGGSLSVPMIPTILEDRRVEGSMVGNLQQLKDQYKVFVEKKVKSAPITLVKPEDTERCIKELEDGTFQGRYVIDWTKE